MNSSTYGWILALVLILGSIMAKLVGQDVLSMIRQTSEIGGTITVK